MGNAWIVTIVTGQQDNEPVVPVLMDTRFIGFYLCRNTCLCRMFTASWQRLSQTRILTTHCPRYKCWHILSSSLLSVCQNRYIHARKTLSSTNLLPTFNTLYIFVWYHFHMLKEGKFPTQASSPAGWTVFSLHWSQSLHLSPVTCICDHMPIATMDLTPQVMVISAASFVTNGRP